MDLELRELERRALAGDADAALRFVALHRRTAVPPKWETHTAVVLPGLRDENGRGHDVYFPEVDIMEGSFSLSYRATCGGMTNLFLDSKGFLRGIFQILVNKNDPNQLLLSFISEDKLAKA